MHLTIVRLGELGEVAEDPRQPDDREEHVEGGEEAGGCTGSNRWVCQQRHAWGEVGRWFGSREAYRPSWVATCQEEIRTCDPL